VNSPHAECESSSPQLVYLASQAVAVSEHQVDCSEPGVPAPDVLVERGSAPEHVSMYITLEVFQLPMGGKRGA
jgi:hypothetical protein